jgi:acyl-CoA synthetase (AMP-forming)/AMP-acid ligase II
VTEISSLLRRVTDEPALVSRTRTRSGRALVDDAHARAGELAQRGVRAGDRVASTQGNTDKHVVDFLACWSLGAVWVPINPAYGAAERGHIVADCAPRVILHDDRDEPLAAAGAEAGAPELALLIYTSGTTGRSKGCALTHENVIDATRALMERWHMSERDVLVHTLPLFHVHGLCVALCGAFLTGARVLLRDKFDPADVARACRDRAEGGDGATVFMGVPTMYRRLLDHLAGPDAVEDARALARARLFCSGSAPLPASDFHEWRARTGHEIVERYGMSETLITLSNPTREDGARKPGTVGTPLAGVAVKIVDDELWVRGPGVMRAYWNAAEQTSATFAIERDASGTETRWLKTGDAASIDDDGYVTIRGRLATDFVKVGGYKVSTREVEDALRSHPSIVDVAVVGVPDREWGERIVACIAARSSVTLADLQQHVALAKHKLPRGLLVVDALPKNAMGKVQKRALAQLAVERGA